LLKVINILKDYQEDLKAQAQIFLDKVEENVSKEAVNKYYNLVKPLNGGNRWYDNDPVISKTIELLRVVPQSIQNQTAQMFIKTLKENGIEIDE